VESMRNHFVKDLDKISKDIGVIYTIHVKLNRRIGVIVLGVGIVLIGLCFILLLEKEAIYISLILIGTGLFLIYFGYKLSRDFQKRYFKGRRIWTFWGMLDYYKRN
jgi:uncharacterized membrane protein